MHLQLIQIRLAPCFPKNKTGLILIFTSKYVTRDYVWEMFLFSSIKKQSCKVENYEISKYTKKLKIFIYIYLQITRFIIKKRPTINHSKITISSSSGMSCKLLDSKVAGEFSFN